MLSFIQDIDIYGKTPNLYYKGKPKKSSWIGIIFTIIYSIIYLGYLIYKLYRLIKREDIKFYDAFIYDKDYTEMKFTNENFYIAFGLYDDIKNEPFLDESVYYPVAYYRDENSMKQIDIEICNINKFGSQYKNIFKDYPLNKYYCLSNVNHDFKSYINSFIIKILPCQNNNCKSDNDIKQSLIQKSFVANIEDVSINPSYDNSLIKPKFNSIYNYVYSDVGQSFYVEMNKVRIEIDKNIIAFESSKNIETKEYLKFDKLSLLPAPSFNDNDKSIPICDIEFQLDDKIMVAKIKYKQLFDVLAEIGGFMGFFYSFFHLIIFSIIDILYDESIVNNLFSFEMNKKIILFNKNNNNEDLKIIKSAQTYNNTTPVNYNSAENELSNRKLNNEMNENNKNKLFPDNIQKKKT